MFFNPISFKCAIRDVRPTECQIYQFNFEYNFEDSNKIIVFIVEKCEALTKARPVEKSSLEETIKEYLTTISLENNKLHELSDRIGIPFYSSNKLMARREIRRIQENFEEHAKWIDISMFLRKKPSIQQFEMSFWKEKLSLV